MAARPPDRIFRLGEKEEREKGNERSGREMEKGKIKSPNAKNRTVGNEILSLKI